MSFERVLVVGAGQMGAGIAQVVAASGREVFLHDAVPGAVERGLETMRRSLAKLHEKGGAAPDEVLVTRTVRDLVAGSGILFEDRGVHELKGVPDTWQLYAATS